MSGQRRESDDARVAPAEAAAAEWLVKHDRGLTPAEQDAFLQWLTTDPAHREAFERHRRMWRDFNALAQWRPEHSAEPNPDLLARPRRRRLLRWVLPAVIGLAAALALVATRGVPFRSTNLGPVAIEAAGYRQEILRDGSTVDLNHGAHVVVHFTRAERRVVLVQGEAQFTVAKNPARPFIVRAGGVDVRAVGTSFNVKLAGAALEVLVTEGTVHVSQQVAPSPAPVEPPAASAAPEPSPSPPPLLAELSAGHRTVIAVAPVVEPPVVVPATSVEIEQALEWKPRLLDFDATPLAEVIEVFNRRNATRLTLADEELRTLPIVASIRSDNVAGFVRLLEATMDVRAERRPGEIVLHRAR